MLLPSKNGDIQHGKTVAFCSPGFCEDRRWHCRRAGTVATPSVDPMETSNGDLKPIGKWRF